VLAHHAVSGRIAGQADGGRRPETIQEIPDQMLDLLLLAIGGCVCAGDGIPFEAALDEARVELSSLASAQREGVMLGNGDLYGIVWERDGALALRVTKNDIWDARVDTSKDGPLPKVDIRNNKVTGSRGAPPSYRKPYPQPRCAAVIRIGGARPESAVKSAVLDLRRAVATIVQSEPTKVRILADRNVVLIQTPEPVRLEAIRADTLPAAKTGKTGEVPWLHQKIPADTNGDWGGMEYALAVAARGNLKAVSLVSSYDIKQGNVLERAIALAVDTLREPESELITAHEKMWQAFWSRSGIELADKQMQRWWYRVLYFAHTVCKPGAAPVGIMPPLATDVTPWHADYHHNYNSWQAFWPLPASNHPELADPWISYLNDMLPRFRYLAKVTYDCEGVFFPISSFLHEPAPAVCKSNNKRQMSMNPWGLTIGMVGMGAQSMWQKHLCDPDRAYLEAKIYPTLREAARFYVSFMEKCGKDEKGRILLGPSYSPEHGPWGIANCPFDIAYVHYTFDAFTQAAGELKRDAELVAQCRKYKKLLGPYPTATHDGEEIVVDWEGGKHVGVHNITVPAAPVFPGDQVTWFSPEAEKALFRRTIKATRFNGNNSHVMFNIAKARLSMAEGYGDAREWFASRELPNGLFAWKGHRHGTFMGEMIGIVGLIDEFLMQSVGNTIRVFPCWPDDKDARFADLRAQGGFLVSAERKGSEVVRVKITCEVGGTLRLLSPWRTIAVRRGSGTPKSVKPDAMGVVTLRTRGDEVLLFTKAG